MKRTTKSKTSVAASKGKGGATRKRDLPVMMEDTQDNGDEGMLAMNTSSVSQKKKYLFTILAVFIIVALAGYKFKYLLVPAKVGNQPIFIWQYVGYMHKTYGKEALQTLSTQVLIEQEIARNKIVVKPEDIQHEVD